MGEKGERGEKGEKGEKGDPGEQGPQGEPGITPEEVTDAIDAKQNKLTGQAGQVVGFDMDGAAVAVPGWSNPNLLDNWHFADPINQRGQTEYTGAGYTIDRWCSFSSSLTVSVAEDGVELSAVNSDWGQLIPPGEFPPGEYTVSILTSEGKLGSKTKYLSGDNANTALSTLTGAFGDTGYYCNLRREWSGTRGTLCAVQRRSGTAKLVAIKLELGPVQTLAHQDADGNWVLNDLPPNKALELAKCQRYYQPLPQYTSMIVYTNNDYEKYFDVIIAGPPMRIQGTVIHPEYIAQSKSGAIVIYSEQTWQHRVRFYSDNTLPAKGSLVEVQQNGCGISADL